MTRQLLLVFLIFSIFACGCEKDKNSSAQAHSFSIRGHVTGMKDSTKLMLKNLRTDEFLDSAYVMNDSFHFEGTLNQEPEELRIMSSREDILQGIFHYTDLLIGNETVALEGEITDFPNRLSTTGSASQAVAEAFHKSTYGFSTAITSLTDSILYGNFPDQRAREATLLALQQAKDSLVQVEGLFIEENFNTHFALLQYSYRRDFEPEKLARLYATLSDELKATPYGQSVKIQLDHPTPQIGEPFHDFEAIQFGGDVFTLAEVKDKYILLQFPGIGCYGSDLSVAKMKELQNKYQDSFVFVSSFSEPDKEACQAYVKEHELTWVTTWQAGGKYGEAVSKYGMTGTPTFFLISPDNRVIDQWFGFAEGLLEEKLDQALASTNSH